VKEDVLEQIVDDYLQLQGYFTMHNVRFKPSPDQVGYDKRQHSVTSEVDVLGLHPNRQGHERVAVVSCKSWQRGFRAGPILAQLQGVNKDRKRPRWRSFRELWDPVWAEAFMREVEARAGTRRFTYYLAVTRAVGDVDAWQADPTISANLHGNPLRFLSLATMWEEVLHAVTTTPAASELGRMAQLLKAAGLTAPTPIAPPTPIPEVALDDD
jgi:hypothetical protein